MLKQSNHATKSYIILGTIQNTLLGVEAFERGTQISSEGEGSNILPKFKGRGALILPNTNY